MSERIEQILLLIRVMKEEPTLKDIHSISVRRKKAVPIVAELCNVKLPTIMDKCTRQVGINAEKFDDM